MRALPNWRMVQGGFLWSIIRSFENPVRASDASDLLQAIHNLAASGKSTRVLMPRIDGRFAVRVDMNQFRPLNFWQMTAPDLILGIHCRSSGAN
jgi:hypothetical protein